MLKAMAATATMAATAACIPSVADRSAAPPAPAAPPPVQERPAPAPPPPSRPGPAPPSLPPEATPPPAWEARPVTPDARTVEAASYTVRSGDTLRAIADRTGAGSEAIARANGLAPPFTVRTGQDLAIPGGRYHLVRTGESGIAIARAYGIDWSTVVAANALEPPFVLRTGMRLLLPSSSSVARMTPAQRAAAFRLDIDDILTGGEPALAAAASPAPARATPARARALPATVAVAEPRALASGFAWPARGPILKRFGPGASGERNEGVKIGMPAGTPVLAAADGVVVYVGDSVPALGGLVLIKHGDGWTTAYGHTARISVTRGQAVKRGQQIARSGETGFADRPQLHFEMRKGRTPVNPLAQLPR